MFVSKTLILKRFVLFILTVKFPFHWTRYIYNTLHDCPLDGRHLTATLQMRHIISARLNNNFWRWYRKEKHIWLNKNKRRSTFTLIAPLQHTPLFGVIEGIIRLLFLNIFICGNMHLNMDKPERLTFPSPPIPCLFQSLLPAAHPRNMEIIFDTFLTFYS